MSSSIRRSDLLALSNLRNDGRKPNEIRRLQIQIGPLSSSFSVGGSAIIEMGLTTVLSIVRGPIECHRKSDERNDRAVIDVIVKMTPFATMDHRRTMNHNNDRKLIEISHIIQRVMESTIEVHLFPKSRIEITIIILADDGSKLCAAINATSLALQDAGIPLYDLVCACTAGYVSSSSSSSSSSNTATTNHDSTLVDLNRKEESFGGGGQQQGTIQFPCVILPQRNKVIFTQCESKLPNYDSLEQVLQTAMNGCHIIFDHMQIAIRQHAMTRLAAITTTSSSSSSYGGGGSSNQNTHFLHVLE